MCGITQHLLTKFLNSRQIAKILIPPFKNNYDIHSARRSIDRESYSLLVHVCVTIRGFNYNFDAFLPAMAEIP